MIRELILVLLILLVCGPLLWLAGLWKGSGNDSAHPIDLERKRWMQLWFPQLPGAMVAAALIGWALTESPTVDEELHPAAMALAFAFAAWWLRAAVRALGARGRPARAPLAATVGLVRPEVRIAPVLAETLDEEERRAVELHERAHARHRDPLRIWLAQLLTDLQLPTRAARCRFQRWMAALELARDDEARRQGADGAALASAIVVAARMQVLSVRPRALCSVLGSGGALEARIHRLLQPLVEPVERPRLALGVRLGLALILLGDLAAGVALGDDLVRMIPGVLY